MNYQKIHDSIIERAKNRNLLDYKERHHIIPKCLGGSDNLDNLVDLTAREHFIIHKILC
jgi:5-methylcytosine-specific restriction endonuclease McrA